MVFDGLVHSGGSEGKLFHASLPVWWLVAINGIPWLIDALLQSLPPFSPSLVLCSFDTCH